MSKSQTKSTLETEESVARDNENPTGGGEDANVSTRGEEGGTPSVKVGPRTDRDRPTRGEDGGSGSQMAGPRAELDAPTTRGEEGGTPVQKGGPLREDKAIRSDR